MTVFVAHNQVKLALHTLREGDGPSLLLLHALGEHSPGAVPAEFETWPGRIFALDFTGHGASTVPGGGGYTAEVLMGDADSALWMTGPATVAGRGLGAYIALLIAGGRPELVRGAILLDGPGLAGGGDRPGPLNIRGVPGRSTTPDRSPWSNCRRTSVRRIMSLILLNWRRSTRDLTRPSRSAGSPGQTG
ncbi:MAG: alpha/beta hydrolase [Dehalococcoidia bacterium]|nr:alpha/beta hydrolase [Dehalococcoidia bacterium]